ncbi:MAG: hypothetical protein ABI652_03615 [Acidobacteriota bacterium]
MEMPRHTTGSVAHSPGAGEVAALFAIETLVAGGVWWANPAPIAGMAVSLGVAAAGTAIAGLPALFWVLSTERGKWPLALMVGALAGSLSPLLILASGLLGQVSAFPLGVVRRQLLSGAPLPWYGSVSWRQFLVIEAHAALVGTTTALIFWFLLVSRRRSRSAAQVMSFAAWLAAVEIASMIR